MKILGTHWTTFQIHTIGYVWCENEMGEQKVYCGVLPGGTEEEDSQRIIDWGGKVEKRIALAFFPKIDESKYAWD